MLKFFGKPHDQWNVGTLFPRVVFASWHPNAMIRPHDYDGVFPKSILFQLIQDFAGLIVNLRDGVVVTRPCLAEFRDVGVVGRNGNPRWVVKVLWLESIESFFDDCLFRNLRDARMTCAEIENGEEWLIFGRPPSCFV